MAELQIKLTQRAAEAWAERARREGHATTGEALGAWAEREAAAMERSDPAEVRVLRERSESDPKDDVLLAEVIVRLATKHGINMPPRGSRS
jgi:hypothetical protein